MILCSAQLFRPIFDLLQKKRSTIKYLYLIYSDRDGKWMQLYYHRIIVWSHLISESETVVWTLQNPGTMLRSMSGEYIHNKSANNTFLFFMKPFDDNFFLKVSSITSNTMHITGAFMYFQFSVICMTCMQINWWTHYGPISISLVSSTRQLH